MPKADNKLELIKVQIRSKIEILEKNLQEVRWSQHYHIGDDMFLQGQINGYRNTLILLDQ